jgi:hypothetical protein
MEIRYSRIKQKDPPKDIFVVTVYTMQGDAADEHEFKIYLEGEDELKKCILGCETLNLCYPDGKSGYEYFDHCLYWDDFFDESWYHSPDGCTDSFEDYSVTYFNKKGLQFDCHITMDEDMINTLDDWKKENLTK